MGQRSGSFWLSVSVDRDAPEPLQRQLYEQMRGGILDARLLPGTRLPASRALALEVGCSRNTVLEALSQLTAEGYLESVRGSGVYVASELPERSPVTPPRTARRETAREREPEPVSSLSERGRSIAATRLLLRRPLHAPFSPSMPDVSLFPLAIWMQLTAHEWRERGMALVAETDPRGFEPLRDAIAEYVQAARNVTCSGSQVIVTAGAQQALDLVARLLLDPGDRVWVEDPGYPALRELFRASGAEVVPVRVDEAGIAIADRLADTRPPRVIAVAPSHQFPTGITMTLERRLALLEYAERVGAWIVEDDYDGEFRYEGRPLAALAGIGENAAARVFYVGTFSKMLFPAIRLGFVIVPKHLVTPFARARIVVDQQPSIFAQPALARFIADGHLAAHVRRMRRTYRARQDALLEALRAHASSLFITQPDPAGMHLVAKFTHELSRRYDDVAASQIVAGHGINAQPLSMFYTLPTEAAGFLLGYACADEKALKKAVRIMATALLDD